MTKKITLLFFLGLVLAACQKEDPQAPAVPVELNLLREIEPLAGREPLSKAELDQLFLERLERGGIVAWSEYDDYTIWSAAMATDSVFSIGYAPEDFSDLESQIHLIDVNDMPWRVVRNSLVDYIVKETAQRHPEANVTAEDLLVFGEKPLPYFNIRIWDYEVLARVRNFSVTRYAEPMDFGFENEGPWRSDSGCGSSTGVANPDPGDFYTAPQGARVSWNFIDMKIHRAWFESNRGDGITIGMIDTGVSLSQAKLNEEFSGGFSGSRTVERYGFHEPCYLFVFCENDGNDDLCGHGTNMAGTAVGPASADGSFAGVAFRSNLVGIRATEDVIHNTSAEKNGVSDAYTYLGNRSDVEIISMSLGDLFSSGQITDAINYAYNQGKLIFNAAGTSLSFTTFVGVIYPANLSNTVAVTGIKTGSPMEKCTTCHSGPQVDFAITMEDQNDPDRTPLTLSLTGNNPDYTGGSSVATATAAGIAALVWSNDPGQSREEVMEALKASGSFYPARDVEFGWGKINARTAVLY